MLVRTGRFRRADRLLQSRDFKQVLRSGERRSSEGFAIFLATGSVRARAKGKLRSRLGITASKRVGNAVVRNRIKRQVREWFRQARLWLPGERDIVVIVRPAARELSSSVVAATLDRLVDRPAAAGIDPIAVESR